VLSFNLKLQFDLFCLNQLSVLDFYPLGFQCLNIFIQI